MTPQPQPTLNELLRQAGKILADIPPESKTVETVSEYCIPKLGPISKENTIAIRQMIAAKNRVDIPPGVWPISNDIRAAKGTRIAGLGPRHSKPALYLDPASPEIAKRRDAKCWFSLIQSNAAPGEFASLVGDVYGLPYGTAEGASVSNLRLSGSFNAITNPCTIAGIALEGTAIDVRCVDLEGFAKGLAGGECFPVRIFAPRIPGDYGPSSIIDCRLINVGNANNLHRGLAGEEITVFSVVGSPECQIQSPRIERCTADGIRRNKQQPSPIQVFHMANCRDAILRDCVVADSDATGFYVDSGTSINTRILGNTFRNIHRGVVVNGARTEEMTIAGNNISTYWGSDVSWNPDCPPACVLFRAPGGTKPIIDRAYIYANAILGGAPIGTQAFFPRGIYVEAQDKVHVRDIQVFNNIIEVARVGADPRYYSPIMPNQLSIYFAFTYAWHNRAIQAWNNRSQTGVIPKITVVDSQYKPVSYI